MSWLKDYTNVNNYRISMTNGVNKITARDNGANHFYLILLKWHSKF